MAAVSVIAPAQVLAQANPNAEVEASVRALFSDAAVMIDVAKCESGFRQFGPGGAPLYDPSHTYIGVFQISEAIHTPRAKQLGHDLTTVAGNLGYARYLYDTQGTTPWKGCLPNSSAPSPAVVPAAIGTLTTNLQVGMTHAQVKFIQEILNRNGFVIAASGPGSAGSETNYFGVLTKAAVRKFQCEKGIACDGSESTTGFGRVGPKTRAALNQLAGAR